MKELLTAFTGFFSHDEAFGLPKGTVRGIAFLMLTWTLCSLSPSHPEVLEALKVAFAAAVGLYWGGKIGNGNGHGTPPPPTPGP